MIWGGTRRANSPTTTTEPQRFPRARPPSLKAGVVCWGLRPMPPALDLAPTTTTSAWTDCSYHDTRTEATCGRRIKLRHGNVSEVRILYPDYDFGSGFNLRHEPGALHTTRLTVDATGRVTKSVHTDFFRFGDSFQPLLGFRIDDWSMPAGEYNVNGCPITYDPSPSALCAGPNAPVPISIWSYRPDGAGVPFILDTDLGVFMDDPFALAYAAMDPKLDLELVIATGRDTTRGAYIAAKILYDLGQKKCGDVEYGPIILAGGSTAPTEAQLLDTWALEPPARFTGDWEACLRGMVLPNTKQRPEGHPHMANAVKRVVREAAGRGYGTRAAPVVYWLIGPAESIGHVRASLSPDELSRLLLLAVGGSIVPGNRLFIGAAGGFTPWAETNVKGADHTGAGEDVANYNAMMHAEWAGVILAHSEPACDSRFQGPVWESLMGSERPGGALLSEMLTAWYRTAEADCDGCRSTDFRCAPCTEALELGSHGFRESPAQCDLKSLMVFMHPSRFHVEDKRLRFETNLSVGGHARVRGCTIECTESGDDACGTRCARVAVSYKARRASHDGHADVLAADGFESRDALLLGMMRVFEAYQRPRMGALLGSADEPFYAHEPPSGARLQGALTSGAIAGASSAIVATAAFALLGRWRRREHKHTARALATRSSHSRTR